MQVGLGEVKKTHRSQIATTEMKMSRFHQLSPPKNVFFSFFIRGNVSEASALVAIETPTPAIG